MIIVIFGGAYDRRRRRKKILNRKRKEGDFSVAILQQSRSEFCRTKIFQFTNNAAHNSAFFFYMSVNARCAVKRGLPSPTIAHHRPSPISNLSHYLAVPAEYATHSNEICLAVEDAIEPKSNHSTTSQPPHCERRG